MPLRRCARLAPLGQRARCLGSGSAAEAPDALIRRLGRDILRHVPAATRVRELEQQVGCALCIANARRLKNARAYGR